MNLKPGEMLTLSAEHPIKITASATAAGPRNRGGMVNADALTSSASIRKQTRVQRGTAGFVRTSDRKAVRGWLQDINFGDNVEIFDITTTANPADLEALGAEIGGNVGDTIKAKVGMVNNGPADADVLGERWGATTRVTASAGTEIVAANDRRDVVTPRKVYTCSPSGRVVRPWRKWH